MIKVFRSTEKDDKGLTAFDRMSKYDVCDILHEYLEEQERKLLSEQLDTSLWHLPDWAGRQQVIVAQLGSFKKLKGFLPNKGKGNE